MKLPNLLDSIPEVLSLYVFFLFVCGFMIGVVEGWEFYDRWWFAIVTASTTGFGDLFPKTFNGRAITCIMIVGAWFFDRLLSGMVAAKLIVDSDAWTHAEQEEVKSLLRQIVEERKHL